MSSQQTVVLKGGQQVVLHTHVFQNPLAVSILAKLPDAEPLQLAPCRAALPVDPEQARIAMGLASVSGIGARLALGVAEAQTLFPDNGWWLNRIMVHGERGTGLGSALLEALKKAVTQAGGRYILVVPGGYDADETRQRRFYTERGFKTPRNGGWVPGLKGQVDPSQDEGVYIWRFQG